MKRRLDLRTIVREDRDFKAFLLLGPRQTGKTFLIRQSFGEEALVFNLLDQRLFTELNARPELLRERVLARPRRPEVVIIDEVQKLPALLDEVHLLLEEHGYRCEEGVLYFAESRERVRIPFDEELRALTRNAIDGLRLIAVGGRIPGRSRRPRSRRRGRQSARCRSGRTGNRSP